MSTDDEDTSENKTLIMLGHLQDAFVYSIIFLIARYLAVQLFLSKNVEWKEGFIFALFYGIAYYMRKIYDEYR